MEIIAVLIILFSVFELQRLIIGKRKLGKVEYRCCFSTNEAHEGEDIFLVETVVNKSWIPVPWLKVDIHSSRWLDFASASSVVTQENRRVTSSFILKSNQEIIRKWRLNCLKRGLYTIENVTLIWGDLLGVSTFSTAVPVDTSLVVYPAVENMENIFIPANYTQGDTIVHRWIVDDPFIVSGTREYMQTDPMNRIHWQATARQGKLMVRKNDFTSQFSMAIILNVQSTQDEYINVVDKERIELAIKVAATLLDRAARCGMPARLATNGCTVDAQNKTICTDEAGGIEHISSLLNILARLEMKNSKDFDIFISEMEDNIANNQVIIITSYINDTICHSVKSLESKNNTVKIVLMDDAVTLTSLAENIDIYFYSGVEN